MKRALPDPRARRNASRKRALRGVVLLLGAGVLTASARAAPDFTGEVTLRGAAGFPPGGSVYATDGGGTRFDSSGNLRLMATDSWAPDLKAECHLDLGFVRGDPVAIPSDVPAGLGFGPNAVPGDSRRAVDLTTVFDRGKRGFWYGRFDRLSLHWSPSWGAVTVGRTAVTWGDGLIFNVQDLFNPFDPRDIDREYKTGDDLVLVESRIGGANWQFLAVPRRDPAGGGLAAGQSSFAVRVRIPTGGDEWSLLVASHYHEWVWGAGRVVTVGGAIWRGDILMTRLEDGGTSVAVVTNMDYSWSWFGRNWYGFVEAYYDSLGSTDPRGALNNADLVRRLVRGEVFTLGRAYLAGSVEIEFHPLVHGTLTVITDLGGPSALLQPHLTWDVRENLQWTFGAQWPIGGPNTEYGRWPDPATGVNLQAPPQAFVWLKAWF